LETIVATVIPNDPTRIEGELALRSAECAHANDFLFIAGIPVEKNRNLVDVLQEKDAIIVDTSGNYFPPSWAQVINDILHKKIMGEDHVMAWIPYYQWDLVEEIGRKLMHNPFDVVILQRASMIPWPPFQRVCQKIINMGFAHITKREYDVAFGAKILNRKALDALKESCNRFGYPEDFSFIPLLWLLAKKERLAIVTHRVNVEYPPELITDPSIEKFLDDLKKAELLIQQMDQESLRL